MELTEEKIVNDLKEQLEFWKKTLRLSDWEIGLRIVRAGDMESEASDGECEYCIERKKCVISLLNPIDIPPEEFSSDTLETILVHELLHLHFSYFAAEDGTFEDRMQEQAINLIAGSLIFLKQKTKEKEKCQKK